MKLINDLLILEVPKDSSNHEIKTIGGGQYCQWQIGKAHGVDKLPSGYEYEVIGLRSVLGLHDMDMILKAAGQKTWIYNVKQVFYALTKAYELQITDTTDLLFLKRIKK